jgi:hypothetical protein
MYDGWKETGETRGRGDARFVEIISAEMSSDL